MIEKLGKHGLRMFLGAAAIFVVGAGVAWAAIPGSNGVINGCYEKRTGILRVVDAETGKKCLSFETPISWNQAGLQGPTGEKGPTGDKGLTGDKGPQGDPGVAGDKGPMGDQGLQGDKGLKGDPGDKGQTGDQGPAGDKGPVGDKGPQGDPGPTGGGLAGYERIQEISARDSTSPRVAIARCPLGKHVTGGGYAVSVTPLDEDRIAVSMNRPFSDSGDDIWIVRAVESGDITSDWSLLAYAICAT